MACAYLGLGRQLEGLEEEHCPDVVAILHGGAKLNEALVQHVGDLAVTFVHNHLRLAVVALNVLHVPLDGKRRHAVGVVDAVPNAKRVSRVWCGAPGRALKAVPVTEARRGCKSAGRCQPYRFWATTTSEFGTH